MTLLEIMVVIAIIGGVMFVFRSGFRVLTDADLSEDASELASVMRRAQQLAVEHGEQHRIVFDLDKGIYAVEVCQGKMGLQRNEALRNDDEETKRAAEKGKERLRDLPADALAVGDPDEALRRATAIAGHHIADRTCGPVTSGVTGQVEGRIAQGGSGKEWFRALHAKQGIKFKEIWVQHKDDSTTKGQIAIYFFPTGSSEKAVVELTDGSKSYTLIVHGLTGSVVMKSSKVDNIDNLMMRNLMGDKDAKREDQQ
jgi:type II secretory pathway pseudopilin PulG